MIGTYRVKKYVSDLKLDPLFWVRVLRKNDFFASCRSDPSAAVPAGAWRVIAAITKSKRFRAGINFCAWLLRNSPFGESLRDIEDCLSARSDQLYHLGFRSRVCRSTLADANEVRDWRIYADLAARFVRYVSQPIDPDTGLCSDHIGRLGGFYSRKDFPDKLRLVRFYDTVQDRRFCFLTNQRLLPALTNCQLYKCVGR